jgi:uncharacterized protein (TIGR02001 family)
MKKLYSLIIAAAAFVLPTLATAQDSAHSFTGNVTLASDYLFRGQSQTDNNPTIQGGFDYGHESGLYLGTWASNINFAGGLEMDYYGGFAGEVNGFAWDLFGVYYLYPSSGEGVGVDYWEIGPSVSYTFGGDMEPTLGVGFLYSDDFSFNSGESWWLYADFGVTLPNDFGLGFHIGNQTIDDPIAWGTPSWLEYNVSLSKEIGPYTFAVKYSDTDLSEAECFGGTNVCDSTVVFSISGGF